MDNQACVLDTVLQCLLDNGYTVLTLVTSIVSAHNLDGQHFQSAREDLEHDGRAKATILWNEVKVGIEPLALKEKDDVRKRERTERCVVVGADDDDVGVHMAGLDMNKRAPCVKPYVGHGGYRLHVEGCERVIRMESAHQCRRM